MNTKEGNNKEWDSYWDTPKGTTATPRYKIDEPYKKIKMTFGEPRPSDN